MYSRNHNVFALPAFYQPAEQREIGLLRRRPLVHGEQLPDLLLQTRKICFGFDRPRSVSHQQRPVLIIVETRCHASTPPLLYSACVRTARMYTSCCWYWTRTIRRRSLPPMLNTVSRSTMSAEGQV